MPKFIPNEEDLYIITPCIICGEDTGDENKNTCSWECEQEKIYYEEMMAEFIMREESYIK